MELVWKMGKRSTSPQPSPFCSADSAKRGEGDACCNPSRWRSPSAQRRSILAGQGGKLGHHGFILFVIGEILHFERIGVRIKQHGAVSAIVPKFGITPLLSPHGHAVQRLAIFAPHAESRLFPSCPGGFKQWRQALA